MCEWECANRALPSAHLRLGCLGEHIPHAEATTFARGILYQCAAVASAVATPLGVNDARACASAVCAMSSRSKARRSRAGDEDVIRVFRILSMLRK